MADEQCKVSFIDMDGIEHSVSVIASSAYEAVGRGIARFRQIESRWLENGAEGLVRFSILVYKGPSEHAVTRRQFDDWLEKPGRAPRDAAIKGELRRLLDGALGH